MYTISLTSVFFSSPASPNLKPQCPGILWDFQLAHRLPQKLCSVLAAAVHGFSPLYTWADQVSQHDRVTQVWWAFPWEKHLHAGIPWWSSKWRDTRNGQVLISQWPCMSCMSNGSFQRKYILNWSQNTEILQIASLQIWAPKLFYWYW